MALKALCIGINDYPGTGSDLRGCVNDAHDWADELSRRGFDVATLLDRHATGVAIRRGIRRLVGTAETGDTVVVQFSGHGSFVPDQNGDEPDGTDECLCPADISSAADANSGFITDDELFELLLPDKTGVRVVMIADSCHSGTVTRFAPVTTPPTLAGTVAPRRQVRFLPPAAFLERGALTPLGERRSLRRASAPGRRAALTLTGCQDAEFSYDGSFLGRPNGVFSYVALDALRSLPKTATYRQWHEAIRSKLPSAQYPQTPNLYGTRAMKEERIF
jgi:hypothetical protein